MGVQPQEHDALVFGLLSSFGVLNPRLTVQVFWQTENS